MPAPSSRFSLGNAAPRWWLVLGALVVLFVRAYAGRGESGAAEQVRFAGSTMGTTYSVVLGEQETPSVGLSGEVAALLAEVNASMSTYDASSELSRFNRHASSEPLQVSAPLAEVLRMALEVSRASGGAFDVTGGPLFEAWGFGPTEHPQQPLDESDLRVLRERVGFDKLTLSGNKLRKTHPQLRVDLSAIAKGYAVDRVAALLDQRGQENYLVEIGGELRARGHRAPGQPFRVGIEAPVEGRRATYTAIHLSDSAVATSGNYRNHFDLGGQRYGHTIDPRTGRPVRHRLVSATVLHQSCALADAWATAMMVVGPEEAWQLAQATHLDVLLLMDHEGEALRERSTPGFTLRRVQRDATAPSP